ncbi:hypothetical protein Tco_0614664 [Tanacetum coccineum]
MAFISPMASALSFQFEPSAGILFSELADGSGRCRTDLAGMNSTDLRWQKKMHFLLSSMSVVYVLTTLIPKDGENATVDQIKRRANYQNVESSKKLWDSLEAKYMTEDASSKKFLDDDVAWWVDSGATFHVCKDESTLHMGNESTAWHSKAFKLFVIESNESVSINFNIEIRDAIFDDNRFSSVPRPNLKILNGTEDICGSMVPKEATEEFDEVSDQHSYCFNVKDDPNTFDEAIKSRDVAFWKEAINDEIDSIMGNNTWNEYVALTAAQLQYGGNAIDLPTCLS